MITGNVITIESNKISLNGAKNGEATSTAIMLESWGRTFVKGNAKKLYR